MILSNKKILNLLKKLLLIKYIFKKKKFIKKFKIFRITINNNKNRKKYFSFFKKVNFKANKIKI